MQAVTLDNILPATSVKETSPKFIKSEGISFEAVLSETKKELEGANTKEVQKEKPVSKKDEKLKKDTDKSLNENAVAENSPTKQQENAPKISEQLAQEDEKIEGAQLLSQKMEGEDIELSYEQVSWLNRTSIGDLSEEPISTEDFAKMIDSAVEFIPGEASPEELLESAQTLAVNDPAMFLEKAEEKISKDLTGLNLDSQNLQPVKKGEDKLKAESGKERKKDLKLEVTDLRTDKVYKKDDSQNLKVTAKKDYNLTYSREGEKDLQVTLDLSTLARQNITSSDSQTASASGSTFQSMLTNAVQENASDFVKAGNIILKDNNQGNINLVLHPEKLGNVKISLNLSEKMISGSITVHSQEAYEAMKESLESLKNAFATSGFETGDFNLNFSNQNSQFAQGNFGNGQDNQASFKATVNYGDYVAEKGLVEQALDGSYESGAKYSVNIVA